LRILNREGLIDRGNKKGREDVLSIMEAGLLASDPYENTRQLFSRDNDMLYVGNKRFEAEGDPHSGVEAIDLKETRAIYVVGAGKGAGRVAMALEEVLGDFLTDGVVLVKHGDRPGLKRIKTCYGAHPIPDEGCVAGCERIKELSRQVTEQDVVFTIIANGGSSLLTLPEEGISLTDVQRLTAMMQIEKGVATVELNVVRNHLDQMKGGKLSRLFAKAMQFHLIVTDANHHVIQDKRHDYEGLLRGNVWLHNLPEASTFSQAMKILKSYKAWESCPASIRKFLENGTAEQETVKYEEFMKMRCRVFGVMPDCAHFLPAARKKAEKMGYQTAVLSQVIQAEAKECGRILSAIGRNIEEYGEPVKAPVVLFSSGEMLVTVEKKAGIGGRNQEFVLACARQIRGSKRIVIGSVDSDGTDGPGGLAIPGAPSCLGGGIVDGTTADRAEEKGLSIEECLRNHDTSGILWQLGCGIHMEQNISLNDLTVILIQGAGKNGD
jgi:glycerate 2-kinase